MTPSELKKQFAKTHPIASLSIMLIPTKKPPGPEKKRNYEDLWKTAEELKKEKMGLNCKYCGEKIEDNAVFCAFCGSNLSD